MADAHQAHLQVVLDFGGEFEEPELVRHGGALLSHAVRHLLLRQAAFLHQALVAHRHLDRIQVLALDVLDDGHLQHALVVRVADVGGNHVHPGLRARAETAFTADDLVLGPLLADRDGLNEPEGTDGFREFLEGFLPEAHAGLEGIRLDEVHRDAEDVGRDFLFRGPDHFLVDVADRLADLAEVGGVVAEEGAEAFAQAMLYFRHQMSSFLVSTSSARWR